MSSVYQMLTEYQKIVYIGKCLEGTSTYLYKPEHKFISNIGESLTPYI